ncbi:MAG TPA: DUF4880 domain-containing protein [Steroidobacteraceae bacterium]|nr:DUF4880 domain-containing protein [Steroidobacteraceae bacterium]
MSADERQVRDLLARQAAEWFVNLRAGGDAAQLRAFGAWLRSSPQHVEAYLQIAQTARELKAAAADPELVLAAMLAKRREP